MNRTATGVCGLVLALAGCASSGPRVEQLGPDSYMVTVEAERVPDGKVVARRQASAEAERVCTEQGKYSLETHLSSGISDFIQGGPTELNFRCVEDKPIND